MIKTSLDEAKKILKNFESKKVSVVGDFYLDEYIQTESNSYSPEAPVPRARIQSTVHISGAAGNVASSLKALGCSVNAIGALGGDNQGSILLNSLNEKGINTKGLIIDEKRVTGTVTRILLKGSGNVNQHVIRLDHENTETLNEETRKKVIEEIKNKSKDSDAIFVADYDEADGTGLVNKELLTFITSFAKENNITTLGISRLNINNFKNFDIVVVNKEEAQGATGIKIKTDEDIKKAGKEIKNRLNCKTTIISLGKKGMATIEDSSFVSIPSFAKKTVDVCGAGDTMSSIFLLAKLSNANLNQAAELSSLGAKNVVLKEGTATVSRGEIEDEIVEEFVAAKKIMQHIELFPLVEKAKKENKKVVLTNGYFDFLHAGHINFLQEAKKLGDFLVVAINSDESTRLNKGANRPLIRQNDRAKILSAFDFVDSVIVFDEMTPIKIIDAIKPDVLVKGGNYTEENLVGASTVKENGGKVVIFPFEGSSTDQIIDHIKNTKQSLHE